MNTCHLCGTAEHGDDSTVCSKCQETSQTSTEMLTHSKDTKEQEQPVTSTRSTHVLPVSETGKPSVEPARITSCGMSHLNINNITANKCGE